MNDQELTALLKELVSAAVSVAANVEVIARAVKIEAEKGEQWAPTEYYDET